MAEGNSRTRKGQQPRIEEGLEEWTVQSEASTVASNGESVDMVGVIKALMAEQRKADSEREEKRLEARRADDERLETLRVRREAEARDHAARLQREAEDRTAKLQKEVEERQFQQQIQLLKLQKEMGEASGKEHREAVAKDRKQERALFNVANCGDDDDLEDYMMMVERRLETAGVKKEEWVDIIESKLKGRLAISWQDAVASTGGYQEARDKLLKGNGYTPRVAADKFFGWKIEQTGGLTVDQLYYMGQQMSRRMLAPGKLSEDLEFSLVKGWLGTVIPRKARAAMDARASENANELVAVLQDFLALEGDGKSATFRKYRAGNEHVREGKDVARDRSYQVSCYQCGKVGHKAADCWRGGSGVPKSGGAPVAGSAPKIICHTCGVEGHKSPQCPRRVKGSGNGSEGKPKPVKQISRKGKRSVQVRVAGTVSGQETLILLDSGADISVVPAALIQEGQVVEDQVLVKGYGDSPPVWLPMAEVEFTLGEIRWSEIVAVEPEGEKASKEVLLSLDLKSERGIQIVLWVNRDKIQVAGKEEVVDVARVTTRSQAKEEKKKDEEEVEFVNKCNPVVTPVVVDPVGSDEHDESNELGTMEGQVVLHENLDDVVLENEEVLVELVDLSVDEEEDISYELVEYGVCDDSIVIPPVEENNSDRAALTAETLTDSTLEGWREGAKKGGEGLDWDNGLLYRTVDDHDREHIRLLVLPKSRRHKVLVLAHEKLGHMGARRVKSLIRQKFAWPGMGQDVIRHCRSCVSCQKGAKNPARKVPLMERAVLSEPFEVMAVDLVGPFPLGKGGYRYLLTCVCMASKWPEAIPLKRMTARSVADGLIEIFSRTGIPLQLVSDQGTQFVGKIVKQLCKCLNIEKITTTPYHPEGNGVVERLHGTLVPMLTKASSQGLDWVGQVPFALFALRSAPNRDTLYSPFELVYGRQVRTPLDVLHQGWVELDFEKLNTSEWADWLVDRLECWHEVMRQRNVAASKTRKKMFDRKAVERVFEVGNRVLCRIPGMTHKLQESWHGPYPVVEVLSRVDYKVEFRKGNRKVLHVNNMKLFHGREEEIMRLSVIAEDMSEDGDVGMVMSGVCKDFETTSVAQLKLDFPEVFSNLPGKTDLCKLRIETGDSAPIALRPYRPPDRLKDGVREEVDKLVRLGVAEPSFSPWASPVVPVPKKDGTLRICIDYRRLNSVTVPDPYYMCTLEEILEKVGKSGCLSKLDLSKGYYQIAMEDESKDKTAFVTPFGKYRFTRMPFGLRNAPAIFQRTMEEVLRGCYEFSAPYIDDILVFSRDGVEQEGHLREVFKALSTYGLTVKEDKCEFGRTHLEYLGHLIGGGQLAVPSHRAAAMDAFILPKTRTQLRSFLGSMSYYRRFILNFASYSAVLTPATSKSAPSVVVWDGARLRAFNTLKGLLCSVCSLTIPSSEDCFTLNTDASGLGIGATLNVIRDGVELPVAFFSRQLQGAQKNYSATELEGLAMFKSIFFFDHFLYGRRFSVYTDHQALVSLLKSKRLNKRLQGWMLKLLDFHFEVIYRPGRCNGDADGLSRQAWCNLEEEDSEEHEQLRTAVVSRVGGDVGIEPHRSRVATSGVALRVQEPCASTSSGVQRL